MAVYTTRVEAEETDAPVLLANGNLVASGKVAGTTRHFATWHDPLSQALLSVRPGGRPARLRGGSLRHRLGARGGLAHLRRARQGGPLRLRHGCAQARHALGRGGVRPRIRSRHLHDRGGVGLQHGRHGEQGPQRLQRQIRAGERGDRDRRRFRRHRGRDRARIFPQLDRQSHHLPRLVPALPQGGPHGLPRPGVQRRPALAPGRAHQRRARPAGASIRRGCGTARPSGAALALSRDQQLLHHHDLREGRRGGAHAQDAARPAAIPRRAWTSISPATTARRRPSSSSCNASRRRAAAISISSCSGIRRPARPRSWSTAPIGRRPAATAWRWPRRCRRRRASPARSRW